MTPQCVTTLWQESAAFGRSSWSSPVMVIRIPRLPWLGRLLKQPVGVALEVTDLEAFPSETDRVRRLGWPLRRS